MVTTQPYQAPAKVYGSVPRLWSGTVAILATGPSLTQADCDACRSVPVIAIKDAIRFAPWADALYSCGSDIGKWWHRDGPTLGWYRGMRYTLDPAAEEWATVLKNTGELGLEEQPTGLRTGRHSGYQAINLAVHLGANTIVLVGYDGEGTSHFFGAHPDQIPRPPLDTFNRFYDSLVEPLRTRGVRVINASRRTAITVFPRMPIEEAIPPIVSGGQ